MIFLHQGGLSRVLIPEKNAPATAKCALFCMLACGIGMHFPSDSTFTGVSTWTFSQNVNEYTHTLYVIHGSAIAQRMWLRLAIACSVYSSLSGCISHYYVLQCSLCVPAQVITTISQTNTITLTTYIHTQTKLS